MHTPITEMVEMILMALCDFLETKYRFAINNGKFTDNKFVTNDYRQFIKSYQIFILKATKTLKSLVLFGL